MSIFLANLYIGNRHFHAIIIAEVIAIDLIIIAMLCILATLKVTLQSSFSKQASPSFMDTVLFNALIFFTAAILFCQSVAGASLQIWLFSAAFALFTTVFQISYTKALSLGSVSITVMMVNLSMLFPVLLSAVFYHEPISYTRFFGIALTVVSIILCAEFRSQAPLSKKCFLLTVVAMMANGGIGITQKIFGKTPFHAEKEAFVSCSYMLAFFMTACVFAFLLIRGKASMICKKPSSYLFAAAIGVILAIFQWLNTYAISEIDGTVLFPAYSGGSIILSALVGIFLFKDRISPKQKMSIAFGIFAIILMKL